MITLTDSAGPSIVPIHLNMLSSSGKAEIPLPLHFYQIKEDIKNPV